MSFDGVIFDFDGTLADTSEGVIESVEYALRKVGSPSFPRETLKGFIGPSLFISFQRITGLSPENAERAVEYYRETYSREGIFKLKLYDGVRELLGELKERGVKLSVASAKPQVSLDVVVEFLRLDGTFDRVVGPSLAVKSDDKKELVAAAKLTENSVMAGDAVFDIRAAKAVGASSIAALYGFGDRRELIDEKPDFTAENVADLKKILLERERDF